MKRKTENDSPSFRLTEEQMIKLQLSITVIALLVLIFSLIGYMVG